MNDGPRKYFKFFGQRFYYANGDFKTPGIFLINGTKILSIPRFLAR